MFSKLQTCHGQGHHRLQPVAGQPTVCRVHDNRDVSIAAMVVVHGGVTHPLVYGRGIGVVGRTGIRILVSRRLGSSHSGESLSFGCSRCHERCGQWAVLLPVAAGRDPVRDKLVVWRTFS